MSYDQKCYDLAEAFLSDVQNPVKHEDAHKLAQDIQGVIEDYLDELERAVPEDPPEVPSALRIEGERDTQNAIKMDKVWGEVFDSLFAPKVAK